MPLFRWAGNYFSCAADEASHHIDYVCTSAGTESLRGSVRWMQNTYYIHFHLRSRIIRMQRIDLDGVSSPENCSLRPVDLVVTDPLTLHCVVEFVKMFNFPVWKKVPDDISILYPSQITARDLGDREYGFGHTMQNAHFRYAPLMFAIIKRCPEVAPTRAGRVDALIHVRHGDIDLGTITWKDGRDTLIYDDANFSVWTRRHFRMMTDKAAIYYKIIDDYNALHPDSDDGSDTDDGDQSADDDDDSSSSIDRRAKNLNVTDASTASAASVVAASAASSVGTPQTSF